MEAIFSYISFEETDSTADSKANLNLTIDTQPDVFSNVVQMVRKASSMALNTFRRQKTHGKQTRKREFIKSFLVKQTRNIYNSVANVWTKGSARPLWNYGVDISLGLLRGSLTNFDHNLNMARLGERSIGTLSHLTYYGADLMTLNIVVNIETLLTYEDQGKAYVSQTQSWRYPVPKEDLHNLPNQDKVKIECEWIIPQDENIKGKRSRIRRGKSNRRVIYYIHGGAYIIGTTVLYRNWTSILAKTGECPVFAINYRLAPEHPFPGGLHDVFAGYMWLINPKHPMFEQNNDQVFHEPYLASEIIISGDSAGGGLSAAFLNYLNLYLRTDTGELMVPLPKAAILLSPWCDLSCSSKSWEDNEGLDFLPAEARVLHGELFTDFQHPAYSYCFGENRQRKLEILSPVGSKIINRIPSIMNLSLDKLPNLLSPEARMKDQALISERLDELERDTLERFVRHPLVSPIFAELKGLPPTLIQAGECELLRDETIALAYKFRAQNQNSPNSWVRHELYVDMVHDFQLASVLPSAQLSIKQIKQFIEEVCDGFPKKEIVLNDEERKLMKMIDSHLSVE